LKITFRFFQPYVKTIELLAKQQIIMPDCYYLLQRNPLIEQKAVNCGHWIVATNTGLKTHWSFLKNRCVSVDTDGNQF